MAHFYGTVEGNRGLASRLGAKNSGLSTVAASWSGAVDVNLWHDYENDVDMARVSLTRWRGKGTERILYSGPVSGIELETEKPPTVDVVA